jgi:hypothetical protein
MILGVSFQRFPEVGQEAHTASPTDSFGDLFLVALGEAGQCAFLDPTEWGDEVGKQVGIVRFFKDVDVVV